MTSVFHKLRFKKEPKESEARKQLKNELFSFNICCDIGFPYKPTCFVYNEILSILAVGTKTGHLRIYGKPGVEFTFMHPTRLPVTKIFFPLYSKTFLTICSDDSLYLWSIPGINTSKNCILTVSPETSNIRNINCSCIGNYLHLSTSNNSIYTINPESLQTIDDKFICKESLYNSSMDSTNFNKPHLITALEVSKHLSDKLFIGLSNLTIILWNISTGSAIHVYNMQQSIEHISFLIDASEFVVSHSDGSYSIWSCEFPRQSDHPTSPYGPFPCKAITQLRIFGQKDDPYIVFIGGMPRSSHGEKQTVTCMTSCSHVVFELPSKVISFIIVPEPSEVKKDYALLILCEEELIAIDLSADNWPLLNLPYMNCMHLSPILSTCIAFDLRDSFWNKLIENIAQDEKEWPIKGGEIVNHFLTCKDVILTGHENGTICIWNLRTGTYITKILIEKFLDINNPTKKKKVPTATLR